MNKVLEKNLRACGLFAKVEENPEDNSAEVIVEEFSTGEQLVRLWVYDPHAIQFMLDSFITAYLEINQ